MNVGPPLRLTWVRAQSIKWGCQGADQKICALLAWGNMWRWEGGCQHAPAQTIGALVDQRDARDMHNFEADLELEIPALVLPYKVLQCC